TLSRFFRASIWPWSPSCCDRASRASCCDSTDLLSQPRAMIKLRVQVSGAPLPNPRRHLLRREAEVLGDLFVGRGMSEGVDADHQRVVVDVLVPAVGAAGFDGYDFRAVAEDFVLVVNRLTIEEVEA